tara:strand:+ start:1026 stop:1226 length:201 start_codon:yes stop_codon:yes gene_type:complete
MIAFSLGLDGLYFWVRIKGRPRGFIIKPASQMLFSERNGYHPRSAKIGPLYFRTYAQTKTPRQRFQ